jgi:hypothetical protein
VRAQKNGWEYKNPQPFSPHFLREAFLALLRIYNPASHSII